MLKLKITIGEVATTSSLPILSSLKGMDVQGTGLFHAWTGAAGNSYYLFGDIVGIRQADGTISPPSQVKIETACLENPTRIPEVEGRFVLVMVASSGVCEVWTDQFGRVDVYWQLIDGGIVVGTGLDLLPVALSGSLPDSVGLTHSLTVYGSRPAKKHTLYKRVHRLGVNQGLRVSKTADRKFKGPLAHSQLRRTSLMVCPSPPSLAPARESGSQEPLRTTRPGRTDPGPHRQIRPSPPRPQARHTPAHPAVFRQRLRPLKLWFKPDGTAPAALWRRAATRAGRDPAPCAPGAPGSSQ